MLYTYIGTLIFLFVGAKAVLLLVFFVFLYVSYVQARVVTWGIVRTYIRICILRGEVLASKRGGASKYDLGTWYTAVCLDPPCFERESVLVVVVAVIMCCGHTVFQQFQCRIACFGSAMPPRISSEWHSSVFQQYHAPCLSSAIPYV